MRLATVTARRYVPGLGDEDPEHGGIGSRLKPHLLLHDTPVLGCLAASHKDSVPQPGRLVILAKAFVRLLV